MYNPEYSIVCAGDLNSQLKEGFIMNGLSRSGSVKTRIEANIFPPPASKEHITCNKKRTLIQPQRHKAEVLDMGTKDYILTDLEML